MGDVSTHRVSNPRPAGHRPRAANSVPTNGTGFNPTRSVGPLPGSNTAVGPTETAVGPTETTVGPTETTTGPTDPAADDASTAAFCFSTPSLFPSDSPDTDASVFAIHPSLALALLRRQQVAAGRLWLLLRALDDAGRGWLNRTDIEAAFTNPDAPTRFCTPRYLRQLLAEGDGFFWEREGSKACPGNIGW